MTARTRRTWAGTVSVKPSTWTVEIASHKGTYSVVVTEEWFSDAWAAYRDLDVSNGARKVLKRNGKAVHRTTSTRSIAPTPEPVHYEQDFLPIAL